MKQKELELLDTLDNYTEELYNQVYLLNHGTDEIDDFEFTQLSLKELREVTRVIDETLKKLDTLNN